MNLAFFLVSKSQMIQKDPGITKYITEFLGFFMNIIYDFVAKFTLENSLGLAIILFTILVRFMMLPLAVKQQKSMVKMQLIQPEVKKIQDKYGNSKDPEVQKKIQMETQALYKKHNVSLFGGCVPLIIQMPIFFALSFMMNNAYIFIDKLGVIYENLALLITQIPNWDTTFAAIAAPKTANGIVLDFNYVSDMQKVINRFTESDWTTMLANAPADVVTSINTQMESLSSIQFFYGIDLTRASGYAFPGILIPIFAVITTMLSSYIMQKISPPQNEQAKSQQKMMLIFMPLFMGFTTIGLSAGVGLYWITSSAFQCIQQVLINKHVREKSANTTIDIVEMEEKEEEKEKEVKHKKLQDKLHNKNDK